MKKTGDKINKEAVRPETAITGVQWGLWEHKGEGHLPRLVASEKACGKGGSHPTVCSTSGTRSAKGTVSETGGGQRLKVRSEFGKVMRASVGGPRKSAERRRPSDGKWEPWKNFQQGRCSLFRSPFFLAAGWILRSENQSGGC